MADSWFLLSGPASPVLNMDYGQAIPLCRSELLQDFSIEFGRRFCPPAHGWGAFLAKADSIERDGRMLERLVMWVDGYYGEGAGFTLSEDGTVWVCLYLRAAPNSPPFEISFHPSCEAMNISEIAQAFRDTCSIATKLCYGDSPEGLLRKIWKHAGEFRTEGELFKPGNATDASTTPGK